MLANLSSLTTLLTPEQVHQLFGVTVKTLANWRSQGRGPSFCKVSHRPMYRPQDIQTYIDSMVVSSTSEFSERRKAILIKKKVDQKK